MTKSVYSQISTLKQNRYDKVLGEVRDKQQEIEDAEQKYKELEEELAQLKKEFPKKKKAVYDEYLLESVQKNAFEKIGYHIMVLEHEISAHQLKIKTQEEQIESLKQELDALLQTKQELAKVLQKYEILIEIDEKERKAQAQYKEDMELEEFSKSSQLRLFE